MLVCMSVWSLAQGNCIWSRSFHRGFYFSLWVYPLWLWYQWQQLLSVSIDSFFLKHALEAWASAFWGWANEWTCFISLRSHISWARGDWTLWVVLFCFVLFSSEQSMPPMHVLTTPSLSPLMDESIWTGFSSCHMIYLLTQVLVQQWSIYWVPILH